MFITDPTFFHLGSQLFPSLNQHQRLTYSILFSTLLSVSCQINVKFRGEAKWKIFLKLKYSNTVHVRMYAFVLNKLFI
jgi:uncharacterized protein VirK/YbjX